MKMSLTNLLLVCCFVGIAFAKSEEEFKNWFMQQGAQCTGDFPVTDEELSQLNQQVVPDSKNAKCFLACIFKKISWIDEKGMFVEANAVKTAEQAHADEPAKIENGKKLFAACKSVNDESYGADADCERGASLMKCLIENGPKMGFKVQ